MSEIDVVTIGLVFQMGEGCRPPNVMAKFIERSLRGHYLVAVSCAKPCRRVALHFSAEMACVAVGEMQDRSLSLSGLVAYWLHRGECLGSLWWVEGKPGRKNK